MAVIWITGAHGFIGSHLARHLANRGHDVYGIGHGHWVTDAFRSAGLSVWLNSDISASSLGQLARLAPLPTTIYHLAGGSSVPAAFLNPHEDFHRTVCTTLELLEWIRQTDLGISLIAVSSAAVYGSNHTGPIGEGLPPNPFSTYGFHKSMMETICRNYGQNFGVSVAIARLFSVYGAGLQKQLLWDLCNKLSRDSQVVLGGTGVELRDWIHIKDAQEGLALLRSQPSQDAPVFNLASGQPCSVSTIAEMIANHWTECCASTQSGVQLEFTGQSRPGDPTHLIADVGKISALGFHCRTSLGEGVRDYVSWYHRFHQTLSTSQ
jgi:UDP-glucose 4-epimerase